MADYYFNHDGQVYGPIDFAGLREQFEAGNVTTSDKVSHAPDGPWEPFLAMFPAFAPRTEEPDAAAPARKFETIREETAPLLEQWAQWAVIGLLTALLLTTFLTRPSGKWEYKVIFPTEANFEGEMNRLGANGWEMVTARRQQEGAKVSFEVILKRQK